MKKALLFFAFFTALLLNNTSAQIVFSQEYGGAADDDGRWMEQLPDSGFIMVGGSETYSNGQSDAWMVRADLYGNILWTRSFGGPLFDFANMVKPTTDGGFIIAGFTPDSAGSNDGWIIKTNSTGGMMWEKKIGNSGLQEFEAIVQTTDGGYAAVGIDYDSTSLYWDMWVVRFNSVGDTLWTKNLGGQSYEIGNSIQQTPDGGFIINGQSYSYGLADGDFALYKLDANGNTQWMKNYTMAGLQEPHYVQNTRDGGFVIVGDADDLPNTLGQTDIWVIKTDANGDTLWTKVLGGTKKDGGKTIEQTTDGGYIIGGISRSFGLINPNYYLGKLDSLGNVEWENYIYGSSYHDHAYRAVQTSDGGYANFGYFRNASGYQNYALVKVGPDGGVTKDIAIDFFLAPSTTICRGFNLPITLQLTNYGARSETRIPLAVVINDGSTQTILRDTFPGTINPSITRSFTFGQTYDFLQSGTVQLTAYIPHLQNDISYTNDTSILTVAVQDPVGDPTTVSGISCSAGAVTLSAAAALSTDSVFWFSAPVGGELVGAGSSLTTGTLSASTTYYAESQRGRGYRCGPVDNTIGSGSATSTDGKILFDTRVAFKLVSVKVYAAVTGIRIIELRDVVGNILQSKTVDLPIGWSTVYLNFDVPQATDLSLGLGTGSQPLFRNTTGVAYPYSVSRVIEIFGAYPSLSRYYYFYDWNIFVPFQQCESNRIPAVTQIGSAPTTAFDRARCGAGTLTLTANSSDPLSWYSVATGGSPVATGSTFTTSSLTSSTSYYLQVGSCTNRISVQAAINAVSTAPTTTNASNCGPGSITLTATAADPISWYDAATNGNLYGTGNSFQTPFLNTTTTFYAIAGTACPSAAVPAVATINAAIAPTALGAQACGPASVTLSAQSPNTIQWFTALTGGVQVGTGPVFTTPILSATTTYYAQAVSTCPSVRTPVTATIIIVPAPTGTDAAHCGQGSVVLSASSLQPVTWWTASTGGTQVGSGFTFTTPSLNQTTVYYAQANDGACNSSRTAVTASVTITAPPVVTNGSRCGAGTVTLSASSSDPIYWYDAAAGGINVGAGSTFTTPSLTSSTTYWAEAAAACPSNRAAVQAIIGSPAANPSVTNTSICGSGNATLTATPVNAQDPISWYTAASGGTLLGTGTSFVTSVSSTTTFYAVAGFAGCESNPVPLTVNVNPLATAPTTTGAQSCGTGTITLQATSTLPITWYDNSGAIVGTGSQYTTTLSSSATFYAVTNNGNCPSAQVPATATILVPPAVNIGPDTISIAPGQLVNLNAGAGYSAYLWSNNATTSSINVSAAGSYSVTVTDANGCTGSDQTVINVITGINNPDAQHELLVYPNPTEGLLHVTGHTKDPLTIRIISMTGQQVYQSSITSTGGFNQIIDLSGYANGLYQIQLIDLDGIFVKTIIRQ